MRTLACAALLLTLCACSALHRSSASGSGTGASVEKVYVLGIEGMMCDQSCPAKVSEAIRSIDGVREVEVDFEHKRALVRTDPGVELTTQQIDKSFHNQGYFVSSLAVESGR